MPKSNKLVSDLSPNRQTRADLTQTNAGLAAKVLSDPSIFPDTFTAWIPRWIMQNINFRVAKGQLPLVDSLHVVGATSEAAVFLNSWVYFGSGQSPAYHKDPFNRVYLTGVAKSGTVGQPIFNLPAGNRPTADLVFAVVSNGALGVCTVKATGDVVATSGSNVSFNLDGISFRQFG